MWTTDSHVVWPLLSLRNTHSGAFPLVLLSSTGGVGNHRRWYTPSIFYRCGTTNHKVPSTSSMENSWSPFRWQHASPFVRADVPCQFLIRFTFPNQFVRDDLNDLNYNSFSCMYREGSSKLTANTSCTEGSTSAPNFLASQIGANLPRILQMSLLNFQVSLLPSSLSPPCTLTSPLLYFNNKRECSRSFVYRTQIIEVQATQFGDWQHIHFGTQAWLSAFCVCQALYQRVLHL